MRRAVNQFSSKMVTYPKRRIFFNPTDVTDTNQGCNVSISSFTFFDKFKCLSEIYVQLMQKFKSCYWTLRRLFREAFIKRYVSNFPTTYNKPTLRKGLVALYYLCTFWGPLKGLGPENLDFLGPEMATSEASGIYMSFARILYSMLWVLCTCEETPPPLPPCSQETEMYLQYRYVVDASNE